MTTQVLKTRSTIVKATAAVLLAACSHSVLASTVAVNELQQESITQAQTHLVSALHASISEATGIEDIHSHLAYSLEYGAEIENDVNSALEYENTNSIDSLSKAMYANLNSVVSASVVSMDADTYVAATDTTQILPSISAYTAELEQSMQRSFNNMVMLTLSETSNSLFTQTTFGNLE